MIGPDVRRLIAHKISLEAIPPGGGVADGANFLLSGKLGEAGARAAKWVREAIDLVKTAPDNSFGDDDEAIAAELLRRIDERQKEGNQ